MLADDLLYLSEFTLYKWAEMFLFYFIPLLCKGYHTAIFFLHLTIYHGVHSPSVNRLLPHSFIELHICGIYVL